MRIWGSWFLLFSISVGIVTSVLSDSSLQVSVLNSMERVFKHEVPAGRNTVEINAACNEVESFQIVVAARGTNLVVRDVTVSQLKTVDGTVLDSSNIKLYRQEYTRVRRPTMRSELPPGLYPDILVPFINPATGKRIERLTRKRERWGEPITVSGYDVFGIPFEVHNSQNQPIWVDVHVPANATPGVYHGSVEVKAGAHKVSLPVALTVWNFILPDEPTHCSHFGSFNNVAKEFNIKAGSGRFKEIERHYCAAMRDHRLSSDIPSHLLPAVQGDGSLKIEPETHAELVKFIREMRVVDFPIPRFKFNPAKVEECSKAKNYYQAWQQYLKDNGWDKRAYLYLLDEPNTLEQYQMVVALASVIREAAPELKLLVVEQTYTQNPQWPDLSDSVDIWCPLWAFIDRKSINEKLARGNQVWSYTALAQRTPAYHPRYQEFKGKNAPYWHLDRPLLAYRVPTWINRQYNITGLLYWSTVTTVVDPWYAPVMQRDHHFNGGGRLFYPGYRCGIDGPLASVRLKVIRDSMEDYEYFVLLEQRAGKEAVMQFVNRVAPNWRDFVRDPELILQVRKELAAAIEGSGSK